MSDKKIFISLISFDRNILYTINSCLIKAKNPKNIIFGIGINYDKNNSYLDNLEKHSQFRIYKFKEDEMYGNSYKQYLISKMFKNEDYYLQIHSESIFYPNWDEKLINSYYMCKKINKKCIISYYPNDLDNLNYNLSHILSISQIKDINKDEGITMFGEYININECPKKSYGISSYMLFFDNNTYHDIEFDNTIYYSKDFEENFVLGARYWTSGYDIFTPPYHIISTKYVNNYNTKIDNKMYNESFNKLMHIMKLKYNDNYKDIDYLGNKRTIEDYYKILNITETIKETFIENYLDCYNTVINNNINNNEILLDLKHWTDCVVIDINGNNDNIINSYKILEYLNLKYITFKNNIIDNETYNFLINNNIVDCSQYQLNKKHIYIWQSHLFVWQKMIEENCPRLLILEDNCLFTEKFIDNFIYLGQYFKELFYDIIYLGYTGAQTDYDKSLTLINKGKPRLTHSYIITLDGAKKLINKINSLNYPLDEIMGTLFQNQSIKGFRTNQLLTYQERQLNEKISNSFIKPFNFNLIKKYKFYPMYYINLNTRHDRKIFMERQIIKYKLNVTRISATSVSEDDCSPNLSIKQYGRLLSMFNLWDKLKNQSNSIILEDDINFSNNFKEALQEILYESKNINYDIIILGYNNYKIQQSIPISNSIVKIGSFSGLYGYIINKKCMQYLYNKYYYENYDINKPFDEWLCQLNIENKINIYASIKPIINLNILSSKK